MKGTQEAKLARKIRQRTARISVWGLGSVGLQVAVAFANRGFQVFGIDIDQAKVAEINGGKSPQQDIPSTLLNSLLETRRLSATTDYSVCAQAEVAIVCVPTPLNKTRDPNVTFVVDAFRQIAEQLHPGMLICLESTTYPGTTEELVLPILEATGARVGRDFFLAFSPERIDPGRVDYALENTPKVVGGTTPACLRVACRLYETVIDRTVPVSSTQCAEMVKLLENTFRSVNIALVNEVTIMCDKLGLDVREVVEAAATKPYGFMKFLPGPGVGGHCIPLDPNYLAWKLKTLNYNARFIQLAGEINSDMPRYWSDKIQDRLNQAGKSVKGSRVLVLGIAYKKDTSDVRESPALDILALLKTKGAEVSYHDPHVPSVCHNGHSFASITDLKAAIRESDCVAVLTDHSSYRWGELLPLAKAVVDTRNVVPQSTLEPKLEPTT